MIKSFIAFTVIFLITFTGCKTDNSIEPFEVSNKILKDRIEFILSQYEKNTIMNPVAYGPFRALVSFIEEKSRPILSALTVPDPQNVPADTLKKEIEEFFFFVKSMYRTAHPDIKYNDQFEKFVLKKQADDLYKENNEIIHYISLCKLFFYMDIRESVKRNNVEFNKFKALVLPAKKIYKPGETFYANIYVTGLDTTRLPLILLGNIDSLMAIKKDDLCSNSRFRRIQVDNEKGTYQITSDQPGDYTFSGVIFMFNNDGNLVKIPFRKDFRITNH